MCDACRACLQGDPSTVTAGRNSAVDDAVDDVAGAGRNGSHPPDSLKRACLAQIWRARGLRLRESTVRCRSRTRHMADQVDLLMVSSFGLTGTGYCMETPVMGRTPPAESTNRPSVRWQGYRMRHEYALITVPCCRPAARPRRPRIRRAMSPPFE